MNNIETVFDVERVKPHFSNQSLSWVKLSLDFLPDEF